MTTLTVGAGQQYATIAAAVKDTRDGDTVLVQAGTYIDDFFRVTAKITLKSVGGLAVLAAVSEPGNGKGIIVADNDLTIEGFGFTGVRVQDGNGAGIRYDEGNLIVRDCVFWNNQDGILANPSQTGTILIERSEFSHNGKGDGYTHNIYVNDVASLTIRDSYFHDSVVGHEIKSRSRLTTITGNRIQDNSDGNGSYSIDLPDGGVAVVENNIIEKGPTAENYVAIHYGGEHPVPAGSSLTIRNNTLVNDHAHGILLNNASGGSPVDLIDNQLWGFDPDRIFIGGPITQSGNTVLAARPELDLSSRVPDVYPVPPDPVEVPVPVEIVVPENSVLQDWGSDGAVVRSGRILTVGANGRFASLGSALAAAQDGDTIQVAAGTYTNDFGLITKKVVIEGVGGIAKFVWSDVPGAPNGMLVIRADTTLRNLEFTGGHNYNGRQAAFQIFAGKVTIVNSWVHGNDSGILAEDNPDTALLIVNSEIGSNGNFDKGTNNLTIGAIGSLVIRNSTLHGATSAHNISTRSFNTLIENNRIWDGIGVGTSFLVNLGQGGNAIVRNNIIERGPNASNGILVHVGGDGPTYSNSDVRITGNSLITRLYNPDHPYTYFIYGDTNAGTVPKSTVTRNLFFGGVNGSEPIRGIAATGLISPLGAAPVLDMSAPWSAAAAPPLFVPATPGANTLTVGLSELRGGVHAQFTVAVDGVVIGGGIVTADHAAGATQAFTFTGWWGAGQHVVVVTGTNLEEANGPIVEALYVDKISLDGASTSPGVGLNRYSGTAMARIVAGTTKLPDFDAEYYLAQNPDVRASGIDPLQHYLTTGWREGRDPNALFSVRYYLSQNPDVAASGAEPLQHFEQTGWAEGRDPSTLFSVQRYLAANPDVAAANVEPLRQYLEAGRAQGRAVYAQPPPDALVDSAWYYAQHPDVAAAGIDAATHYHTVGWTLRYNPNPWFDTTWYQLQNPDVTAQHIDPLLHFESQGWQLGRDPSPYFSLSLYKAAHPETAGTNPLLSFLGSGEATATPAANRYSAPEAALFDAAFYNRVNPDVAANRFDALTHYETLGWREQRNPSALFDTAYYLNRNPDVAASGVDPLKHYAEIGWKQGRDPSAAFSTNGYLAANRDVASSGMDPLQHYMQNGRAEGRLIYAAAPAADPLVDKAWYYAQHPDVAAAGIDASTHYHTVGWTLRYDPNPWFDTTWYQLQNPTVASRQIDPLLHFENEGWRDGRDPSPYFSLARYAAAHPETAGTDPLVSFLAGTEDGPVPAVNQYSLLEAALFDSQYYAANNPDVVAYKFNPLTHYETLGWREQRNPSALFDTAYYLNRNPDVAASGVDPLKHYAEIGWKQGRDPSAAFSTNGYRAANRDVASSGMDPLQHYMQNGRAEGRLIYAAAPTADPLVDKAWYYAQHPDVAAAGIDASTHYHTVGWTLRYDPNPWFDTTWYQLQNPTVASRQIDPLLHFENEGWRDGRDPSPYFSLARYAAAHPETAGTDPLLSFLAGTEDGPVAAANAYSSPEAALFDAAYYLARNPDVAANHFDPLTHYETLGWREGRDPSATFSTNKYLAAYSDVRASAIDPLGHYANSGISEGRMAFSV